MKPLSDALPSRVIIEGVDPEIDQGRFVAKSTEGERYWATADIYADGHEELAAVLLYRPAGDQGWVEVGMTPHGNDRWSASFVTTRAGWYEYTIQAWIDPFATWRRDLGKKSAAGLDVASELLEGIDFIRQAAKRAGGADGEWLRGRAESLQQGSQATQVQAALDPVLAAIAARHADRGTGATHERVLRLWVDRPRARFGAWYELFPRSAGRGEGTHGTFRDVEKLLPRIAELGFDVLYIPPIHPIGTTARKGPNNTLTAGPSDPGSPWAIGAAEGGHTAIHPQLGRLEDFQHLVAAAKEHAIEIALDIAFQCSPDHPWVREHPQWFRHRPDGTIKYAENPPKKYQDIYPLDFECEDWQNLWKELCGVVLYWAGQGVRIFRIDNPHTKPFPFWEWLIASVREEYPDAIFLSEAFTRPKVMKYLAKSGFAQSYSYFTWRNTKAELTRYLTELTQTSVRHYMRPNLFVNTPDILPDYLQHGGAAAFQIRLVLAATLGASYGVYGPPFECFEATPRPGSEEYLGSEKYQLRHWDWEQPNVFREFMALVNRARRENPALQFDHTLRFHATDNDRIIFYSKTAPEQASHTPVNAGEVRPDQASVDQTNIVLVVVNLDPHHAQSGYVHMPLAEFGLAPGDSYQVQDLLTGAYFLWHGEANYVSLDPQSAAAHILRLRRKARTERDFDYFL